jgi:hypothetical protein
MLSSTPHGHEDRGRGTTDLAALPYTGAADNVDGDRQVVEYRRVVPIQPPRREKEPWCYLALACSMMFFGCDRESQQGGGLVTAPTPDPKAAAPSAAPTLSASAPSIDSALAGVDAEVVARATIIRASVEAGASVLSRRRRCRRGSQCLAIGAKPSTRCESLSFGS